MKDQALVDEARALLTRERLGILSTMSVQHAGFPFGSIIPYALDARGVPVIFISTLAVHTKNLAADTHCSLMILEEGWREDPQAAGRLTLLCRSAPLSVDESEAMKPRYLARHPASEQLFAMKDFSFHALHPEQVRFVAGFGRMGWLDGKDVLGG